MKRRFLSLGTAVFAVVGLMIPATAPTVLASVAPCAAAGTQGTHVINVDAGGGHFGEAPVASGHNWEFTDYFPRGGTTAIPTVKSGDCLNFQWDGGFDSFHTVSFFSSSDTPATHPWTTEPLAVPDTEGTDTGEGPEVNGAAFGPSNPSCGDATSDPCPIDGSTFTNSGGAGGSAQWWTKLNVGSFTGNLWYFCLIHPGMAGYVNVVNSDGTSSTPAAEQTAAQAQYTANTAAANSTEAAANSSSSTTNSNGTHTISVKAGVADQYVELDEMFPGGPSTTGCPAPETACWRGSVSATAGDTLTWTYGGTGAKNIHTVTFPAGSRSDGVDPFLAPVCEGSGSSNPAAPNPGAGPPFGCGGAFEQPFDPAPHGGTTISGASTVATSGVLGASLSPFPQAYSYTFPNASPGLTYQCRIHDDMIGVVQVLAAAVAPAATPALPKAGSVMTRSPLPRGNGYLLVAMVLVLIAVLPVARFAVRKLR